MKAGYFLEVQNYKDPIIQLESANEFNSWLGEISWVREINTSSSIEIGSNYTSTTATSNSYIQNEKRYSGYISHLYQSRKIKIQSGIRQEVINQKFIPIIPSIGIEYTLNNHMAFYGKISRNYRNPTLNDKYWQPGGNTELLPELGWSEELSFLFQKNKNQSNLKLTTTIFNRHISNWILWGIKEGEVTFSASNLAKVWSRGIEQNLAYTLFKKSYHITFHTGYNYILSTNEVEISNPIIKEGTQLLYTPKHELRSSIELQIGNINFYYAHNFTGMTQGINEPIDNYNIGNANIAYDLVLKQTKMGIFCRIDNVWNKPYRIIERRPMPERSIIAGIKLSITKK